MSKTLGYYLNSYISDNPLLIEIEESYKSFTKLNLKEQLYILQYLATSLGDRVDGEVSERTCNLAQRMVNEVEPDDQEGLLLALAARIRDGEFTNDKSAWS